MNPIMTTSAPTGTLCYDETTNYWFVYDGDSWTKIEGPAANISNQQQGFQGPIISTSIQQSNITDSIAAAAYISEEEIIELYKKYTTKHGKKMGSTLLKAMGVDAIRNLNNHHKARLKEVIEEDLNEEEHEIIFGKSGRNLDI